ncbi:MAG: hypothetical protein OXE17_01850 [Chloroflexi bacterium]|nr:hypothetical protein [Chloroflexota bacterium]
MPGQGLNEVASELLRRSRDGKIPWKQTRRDSEYRVSFPDVSLAIFCASGHYRLDLINETGSVIESLEYSPLSIFTQTGKRDELESRSKTLKEIYDLAEAHVQEEVAQRALQYLKQA